jgi:hypothetical protein
MGKRAIKGFFRVIRKTTAGKLAVFQVVAQAVTTYSFA